MKKTRKTSDAAVKKLQTQLKRAESDCKKLKTTVKKINEQLKKTQSAYTALQKSAKAEITQSSNEGFKKGAEFVLNAFVKKQAVKLKTIEKAITKFDKDFYSEHVKKIAKASKTKARTATKTKINITTRKTTKDRVKKTAAKPTRVKKASSRQSVTLKSAIPNRSIKRQNVAKKVTNSYSNVNI